MLMGMVSELWGRVADGNGPGKPSDSPMLEDNGRRWHPGELPWRNLAKKSHRDTSKHLPYCPCIRPRRTHLFLMGSS